MNNESEECKDYVYQFLNTLELMVHDLSVRVTKLEQKVNDMDTRLTEVENSNKTIGYSNITDSWFHKNYQ